MKIQCFDVLMLDLNGTFMFGQDRFGADEEYHRSYVEFGGSEMNASRIRDLVNEVLEYMNRLYYDPTSYNAFPRIADVLADLPGTSTLPISERALLEQFIAHHERGTVADNEVAALKALAKSHRLILVSNIWSQKKLWIDYFREKMINDLFDGIVFSSDHKCIKPGSKIYQIAIQLTGSATEKVLFVGDDPECDIAVPRSLGMSTARVRGSDKSFKHEADLVIDSIGELISVSS